MPLLALQIVEMVAEVTSAGFPQRRTLDFVRIAPQARQTQRRRRRTAFAGNKKPGTP
jgi:hypothetical protein